VPAPNADFIAFAAGEFHSLGLKAVGSIVAWGQNWAGQCDVPAPNADFIALAAGWYHSLGLKADGSIVAWGGNAWGQCDVPAPNVNFIALAAGDGHSLGLKGDGSILAWGDDYHRQCNVPAPNADFIALAAGGYHSLAIRRLTPVGVEPTAVPPTPALAGSFPNPFNPVTTVRFAVPVESRVSLRIYDLQGRVVRTLVDALVPAGWHERQWDARQDAGHRLPGGIFFLRMEANGATITRKLVLMP
jgi:hypothetical protein